MSKKMWIVLAAVVLVVIIGGRSLSSGLKIGFVQNNTSSQWKASYHFLSGTQQRDIKLGEGPHTLNVVIETTKGTLDMTITGEDGQTYYEGKQLPTSSFAVDVNGNVIVKIHAENHRGRYALQW